MPKTIGIIGGDLRIIRLAEILSKEDYLIYTYGLENYNFFSEKILKCNDINEISNNCINIISGIPFSQDGNIINTKFSNKQIEIEYVFNNIEWKALIASGIDEQVIQKANKKNIKVVDLLKFEELAILNAIPTVEGAIKIAIDNTEITLNGSNCLILGFGRIGKILAKYLSALGANVSCMARKNIDFAWIDAYGYKKIDINNLGQCLKNNMYNIIFNTIPALILDRKKLEILKNDKPLIIELASKPWGEDFNAAQKFKINIIKAPGLPGKIAPLTSAINIRKLLKNLNI